MSKVFFLSSILTGSAFAACSPTYPVACDADSCSTCFCFGPAELIANSPVNPRTCDGDLVISVSGLYWKANQDGLEYAVESGTTLSTNGSAFAYLIDAEYKSPKFKNDIGYKIGLSYNSPCDGWDVGVLWTFFRGKAYSHDERSSLFNLLAATEFGQTQEEGGALLALWSAFNGILSGSVSVLPIASDIETNWLCNFHLVDINLGRQYWLSKYLSFRPHVGLRLTDIDQAFTIQYQGGSWLDYVVQPAYNDEVDLKNTFAGIGLRSGFDANWHLGCGFRLYSNLAASIIYGRFDIDHDETVRLTQSPFSKQTVLETKDHFRASRPMIDLALGVEYASLLCDCKYGFSAQLGWEQHLFFHQNQLFRVNRVGDGLLNVPFPNNGGENIHFQRRGTLSASGLTLTLQFAL